MVGTTGLIGQCLAWPAVPKTPPLPPGSETSAVPTLVLQGQEDTRTPLEQSRGIAATYTGGRLLTIPYAGHSVLGSDSSGCSGDAAVAFLARGAAPRPGARPARARSRTPWSPASRARSAPCGAACAGAASTRAS